MVAGLAIAGICTVLLASAHDVSGAPSLVSHSVAISAQPADYSEGPTKFAISNNKPLNLAFNPNVEQRTPVKTVKPVEPVATPEPIEPDVNVLVSTDGLAPVINSITTTKPVVFLTMDDGLVKDPAAIAYMAKHHLRASLFLNDQTIADNYEYFKTLHAAGSIVENHTVSHPDLTTLGYEAQKQEICDNADRFAAVFGKRPTLLRPPFGAYNTITRRAAADCGMTALINWHAKANGGSMQYQAGDKLMPGDIVLMHFRPEIIADLTAFSNAAQKAGLTPVLLEDWVN